LDKLGWWYVSSNPNAISLLEQNPKKIDWYWLSGNPNAIHLLEQNPNNIGWTTLSANPSIFEIDYQAMKEQCSLYKEELLRKALHPSRIERYLEMGAEQEDLDDYL